MQARCVFLTAVVLIGGLASARAGEPVFESGQLRPLALSPDASRLFAVNTPDARLEILAVTADGLQHEASVPVGLEPVAVAVRGDEAWVVNHLSDSVSVVSLASSPARVVRTLWVGDEPRDLVFAGPDRRHAFITTAHRGQHRPIAPDMTASGEGRADIWVFDATNLGEGPGGTPVRVLTLPGDTAGPLATSPDGTQVYVAVFASGNQTTVVPESAVCDGGPIAVPCNLAGRVMPGGLPGPVTNVEGVTGPETGLVVRRSPDDMHWLDSLGRFWDDALPFTLSDLDVFRLDGTTFSTMQSWSGVGTMIFGMTVHPLRGTVYVTNTEARNEVRFEGPGAHAGGSVRGHLHEARITVLDGTSVTPRRLNPHIDYSTVPSPPDVRTRSLALPLGAVATADGTALWIAAMGSGVVARIDTAALEAGSYTPDAAAQIAVTGGGPTGLVLDEARQRLYALTRFDDGISVIDLATRRETTHLRLHDPEPEAVRTGRPLLYDARATSSNGEAACGSCHVFGDLDHLSWDLGNPDAPVAPNPNPIHFGAEAPFHPMKGPMATQTLRGMAKAGPMHWRGDRTGGSLDDGDPLDEHAAFLQFRGAFVDLLGRDTPIPEDDMRRFADFALQLSLPPNPLRALDGLLTPLQQAGRDLFFGRVTDGNFNCVGCHTLAPRLGFFGADGQSARQLGTQMMKIPHLRNLYQKVGRFGGLPDTAPQGPQVRGFGFSHDGSIDTIFRFLDDPLFRLTEQDRRALEAYLLVFDTNLAPVVGQQVTLTAVGADGVGARIDLLRARALAGDCDLVAHAQVGGRMRGWLMVSNGRFVGDRIAEAPLDDAELRRLAQAPNGEITYTCRPPQSGVRGALDRDDDQFLDGDELAAGTDPADPANTPSGLPLPVRRIQIRVETLELRAQRGAAAASRLTFVARTQRESAARRVVVPPLGTPFDPTLHGATLHVYGAAFTTDRVESFLPPSGWRRLGTERKPKGYRFRGKGNGVRTLILAPDVLKARATVNYSLDEPAQGRVAIRIVPGLFDGGGWCAAVSARRSKPSGSTARSDRPGRFGSERGADPIAVCPPLPEPQGG